MRISVLLILLVSACTQPATPLSEVPQQSLPISSSVQITTPTPSPANWQINANDVQWVYALVARFPTVTDGVTFEQLKLAWTQGTAPAPLNGIPLLMEESTFAAFSALWGAPAAGSVRTMPADQLLDAAWAEMRSWAIIPFESLEPKWKVLTIDGQSPIRKNFNPSTYPLSVSFQPSTSLQSLNLLSSSNY